MQHVPPRRGSVPPTVRGQDGPPLRPPMGQLPGRWRQGGRDRRVTSGQGEPRLHRASALLGSGTRSPSAHGESTQGTAGRATQPQRGPDCPRGLPPIVHQPAAPRIRRLPRYRNPRSLPDLDRVHRATPCRPVPRADPDGLMRKQPTMYPAARPELSSRRADRQDQDRPAREHGVVCRRSLRPGAIARLFRAVRQAPGFRPTIADRGRSAHVCGGTAFPRLSPLANGLARHHPKHGRADGRGGRVPFLSRRTYAFGMGGVRRRCECPASSPDQSCLRFRDAAQVGRNPLQLLHRRAGPRPAT